MQQAADDGLFGTLQNLGHAPFRPATPVLPHDADFDVVFVQNSAHFIGGQVDIGLAIVANHKTVSITVSLHDTGDFCQHSFADMVVA